MNKSAVVAKILGAAYQAAPLQTVAESYAPSNIALVKYWGKRDAEINLPQTSSLSIGLADRGASVQFSQHEQDLIILNQTCIEPDAAFAKRLWQFIDLFRVAHHPRFKIDITSNIPIAAGLASSACGFASITKALNRLYGWHLSDRALSILARLGSGSASRSLWPGFVLWEAGILPDGMDSYAKPLPFMWPEFCVGLLILSTQTKAISSRVAMAETVKTSPAYKSWPEIVARDLDALMQALNTGDFDLLGQTAERNAEAMHHTMHMAQPTIDYDLPETREMKEKVRKLRAEGVSVYFTQDAGPNIKLLFLQESTAAIQAVFPEVELCFGVADR